MLLCCCSDNRGESIDILNVNTIATGDEVSTDELNRQRTEPCYEDLLLLRSDSFGSDDAGEIDTTRSVLDFEAFRKRLEDEGIDTSYYGKGSAKSLDLLYNEVYVLKQCSLKGGGSAPLERLVEQVQIKLLADVDGVDHVLVSTLQVLSDSRERNVKQLILYKMLSSQTWKEAVKSALSRRLRFSKDEQDDLFEVDDTSYSYHQEQEMSKGYPGLLTTYGFHQVIVYVKDPISPGLARAGLPEGRSFSTMEGKFGTEDVAARLNVWAWLDVTVFEMEMKHMNSYGQKTPSVCGKKSSRHSPKPSSRTATAEEVKKKVECPEPFEDPAESANLKTQAPNSVLAAVMADQKMDNAAAIRAATRIRDPDYLLNAFFEDCKVAFPELKLYMGIAGGDVVTSSGRSADDEYQRTIGALFAVYWLMRIDIDGKAGFCYGVDLEDPRWRAWEHMTVIRAESAAAFGQLTREEKRSSFHTTGPWESFQQLMIDSGILQVAKNGTVTANLERTKAMLVLTAIHDVMKIQEFLPKVSAKHSPFGSYRADEEIGDHDLALAYVLEYFPKLMPSFAGLDTRSQKAILFTQSKMEFNNGWLVQGEAPPGKLLSVFKKVISSGTTPPEDVAFYFVHWLTDLAGAVPTPLAGAEKFVVQFPHAVLAAFLKSFGVVKSLAQKSETQVLEDYLRMRWNDAVPALPPLPPAGLESVCRGRLNVMSQAGSPNILKSFDNLPEKDKAFLGAEMSITGLKGQVYESISRVARHDSSLDGSIIDRVSGGPALLVYYGPALLQRGNGPDPDVLLQMLISVLRAGRELWPLSESQANDCVTLRIDNLKEMAIPDLRVSVMVGDVFLLVKYNASEAFVEKHPLQKINDLRHAKKEFEVLTLASQEQLMGELKSREAGTNLEGVKAAAKKATSQRQAA